MRRNLKLSAVFSCSLIVMSIFLLEGCGPSQSPVTPQVVLLPHQVMVGPGETVYSIAYQHGILTRALIETNRLQAPYTLVPGQILVIPPPEVGPVLQSQVPTSFPAEKTFEEPEDTGGPIALHQSLEPLPVIGGGGVAGAALDQRTNPRTLPSVGLKEEKVLPPEPSLSPKAPPLDPSIARELALEQEKLAQKKQKISSSSSPSAPAPAQPAGGAETQKFSWPVQGKVIGKYGRGTGGGDGIRIAASQGAPVQAIMKGKVLYAGNEIKNLGNLVLIEHPDGWISAYGCAEDLLVKKGELVSRGQKIALVGQTGEATQPQLYFEIRKNKKPVDPLTYLRP